TENHGYPFAEIKLDSVQILDDQISASLNLSKHRFIRIDSIRVLGDVALSRSYLRAYLDLQEGQAYNEAAISAISNRIRELPFLRELKPPEILFNGDVASIGLFLEEVNASAFDFLIGVLPNSEITGKLTITGEGSLELRNAFGAGEGLALDFRQLQLGTKEFEVRVDYPYLPLLPFGAQFDFELYLRDSSYLDRRTDFGLTYLFGGNDIIKGYVENKRTVILSYDTAEILQSRSLPANLDVLTNRYGLEYRIERLDYRFNPRKGYALTFGGSGGTRKILTNESVLSLNDPTEPDFEFSSLYDSLDLKTASFTLDLGIDLFQPIGRQSVIHFGISGGWIYGGQLFTNELYRLGGARSLRGFDEESIFASLYQISTLEYRFLIGQNSLFYLFGDLAYLEEKSNEKNRVDWPFGFGAGMNFETGAGIFGLSYALGRQQGNPIEFRAAKIHFGYVNRF
ncbi:MAG: outer membrane protein assembly factor BamA, partial [Limisphaerales bacterium]